MIRRWVLLAALCVSPILLAQDQPPVAVAIQGKNWAEISSPAELGELTAQHLAIRPAMKITALSRENGNWRLTTSAPFALNRHYYLHIDGRSDLFMKPEGILDSLYSDKPLGTHLRGDGRVFRVFAPRAEWVRLVLYDNFRDSAGREFALSRDPDGVWEFVSEETWAGKFYGYRLWGPQGEGEMFDSTVVVADPYSRAVATRNHYRHPGKTLIGLPDDFDWGEDSAPGFDPRDLIIYEMHLRDLTADQTSGLPDSLRGTYPGLVSTGQRGGLPYIRELGVNAVELLPTQDFGNIEIPYRDSSTTVFNTWNPYTFNHWGYMTSYFFAPESYYATGGNMRPGDFNGGDGRQVTEFKQMVKGFHQAGIAVIMDVVYNHVSQYDQNCFKYIDKFYYFRTTADGRFLDQTGTGNTFKSERPMARRLIVESVRHWLKEYHIDGFRFDLGLVLDWQTLDAVREAAREINPGVFLTAEPWGGGGYDPNGFADHGWSCWNDQIRNGVKGWNPHDSRGFIFGEWQDRNSRRSLQRYVMGSLRPFGGQYHQTGQSLNYLESHDDHTLGDFIRIGSGEVDDSRPVADVWQNARLSPQQLRLNKLAALFLLTSQGPVMIHEGQEFARSKVIAPRELPDVHPGMIDHNSYEKDDPTNWLNFDQADMNRELRDYYRGLIRLRTENVAFRRAAPQDFSFPPTADSLLLVYRLNHAGEQWLVALNGNPTAGQALQLPPGEWLLRVDGRQVYEEQKARRESGVVTVAPSSGLVFRKFN